MTDFADQVADIGACIADIRREVSKVVVGQTSMIDGLLIGLLTGGHVLLEGVPGLAKTLTVNTFADALGVHFQRVQFTPDLLPADLVGTMIYDPAQKDFVSRKGPVFTNILLGDEITALAALGTLLVIVGAFLASRRDT